MIFSGSFPFLFYISVRSLINIMLYVNMSCIPTEELNLQKNLQTRISLFSIFIPLESCWHQTRNLIQREKKTRKLIHPKAVARIASRDTHGYRVLFTVAVAV